MTEGELKKRILKEFKCEAYEWVCTAPEKDYTDNERYVTVETIKTVIDEATKEFPHYEKVHRFIKDAANDLYDFDYNLAYMILVEYWSHKYLGTLDVSNRDWGKSQELIMKWFGS